MSTAVDVKAGPPSRGGPAFDAASDCRSGLGPHSRAEEADLVVLATSRVVRVQAKRALRRFAHHVLADLGPVSSVGGAAALGGQRALAVVAVGAEQNEVLAVDVDAWMVVLELWRQRDA